ncbi:ATP-dependent RNA helicase RhlE [Hephaestia caeni]|uniref:DEAD-box ATP-dependent RNA helicase RhpA n=1 Tax=Hephaestia caeni TaxID=645617 RepID=A0A397NJ17_9SPHN|nr:DEAD/DEAH box helicase [Hephaestia caeni]RIA37522.1 ATP-dependent RNA helicase RhlE [Hephaestia caeni]
MSFSTLGLAEPLVRAIEAKGYDTPTPIQQQAIPTLLEGRDLLGIAQTGTGKTAAFVLPSLQRLDEAGKRPLPYHCRMLVLTPTRELATQIADNARDYAKFSRLSVATVFGGTSINKNRQDMSRGVDLLVATPGRLIDLIEQRYVNLSMLEILVLDEADQMLDLGFIHALRRIVTLLPKQRQSLFFSATMPKTIRTLADQFLRDPATVAIKPAATTAERVDQFVTFVGQKEKQALLTIKLGDPGIERALVFTRTKHGADRVVKLLGGNGFAAHAIHGNKSQPQRERALAAFKSGQVRILVATDIAARGIDVSGVSHVFNFELPNVAEQYVHRIGRTARAGASGVAISFCADDERPYLRDIERVTRQKVTIEPLPADFVAQSHEIQATRKKAIGADPAPREDRQRGPRRPRATHKAIPAGGARRPGGGNRQGEGRRHDGEQQRGERREAQGDRRPHRGGGDARPNRNGDARATHDGQRTPQRAEGRPAGTREGQHKPHRGGDNRPQGSQPAGDRRRPGANHHRRGQRRPQTV